MSGRVPVLSDRATRTPYSSCSNRRPTLLERFPERGPLRSVPGRDSCARPSWLRHATPRHAPHARYVISLNTSRSRRPSPGLRQSSVSPTLGSLTASEPESLSIHPEPGSGRVLCPGYTSAAVAPGLQPRRRACALTWPRLCLLPGSTPPLRRNIFVTPSRRCHALALRLHHAAISCYVICVPYATPRPRLSTGLFTSLLSPGSRLFL